MKILTSKTHQQQLDEAYQQGARELLLNMLLHHTIVFDESEGYGTAKKINVDITDAQSLERIIKELQASPHNAVSPVRHLAYDVTTHAELAASYQDNLKNIA